MSKLRFLILDAGTSRLRCLVFNDTLQQLGVAERPWRYLNEDDSSSFSLAFDENYIWRSVLQLIPEALANSQSTAAEISAISITSQRQAIVFLDEQGNVVYAGPNRDLRAVFEGATIDDRMGDTIYSVTGHLPSMMFASAKLLWFQNQRPQSYARISGVMTLADWLAWRFTGVLRSEYSLAGAAGLLDISSSNWCSELLSNLGLFSQATQSIDAGTIIGNVRKEISNETGLATDIPVVAAGADTQCGLLGMGLHETGNAGIVAGWSTPVQMISKQPIFDSDNKTLVGLFLEKVLWVIESTTGDMGNSYEWLANILGTQHEKKFEELDALALAIPVGAENTFAMLTQPYTNMSKSGMRIGGLLFPVPLTYANKEIGHLARACLEGFAYSIKGNLAQLESLYGEQANCVGVGGGMVKTVAFTKILANVLGRDIKVASPNVSAVGACMCALLGTHNFSSFQEVAPLAQHLLHKIEPNPTLSAEYDDRYSEWISLNATLGKTGVI